MKTWKYYTGMRWVEDGKQMSLMTQLYQTGTYCIVNNSASMQFGADPKKLGSAQRKDLKRLREKGIEVTLGREIRVTLDEHGLWQEVDKEKSE